MKSQNEQVLEYLQKFGQINPMAALTELGIYRLGARIHDLKNKGHNIKTEQMNSKNRNGEKVRYAKYVLLN